MEKEFGSPFVTLFGMFSVYQSYKTAIIVISCSLTARSTVITATAGRFCSAQFACNDPRGAADTAAYSQGARLTIQGTSATLHACVSVHDDGSLVLYDEHSLWTDCQANAATVTLIGVQL